jgi:protoheme ferro-lyase
LLKDAIRLFERKDPAQFDTFNRRKQKLYSRFEQFVQQDPSDKDARRLIKRLKRHKDELFTFLEYENVSPYNNHAEQQMRKPVLTRKVSQQNRSEQGAKTHAVLMSLFRSAELQGKNPVATVLSLAKTRLGKAAAPEQILDLAA